jgi:hypothetical protein
MIIDPDLDGPDPAVEVYCDMESDDGGWTLVASSLAIPPSDRASGYFRDLATTNPVSGNIGIWNGMDLLAHIPGDLRFSCRSDEAALAMTVDLSFYEVDWYEVITSGNDEASCFFEGPCGDRDTPSPARRNNLTGATRLAGDSWDGGCLIGETTCNDSASFVVDFDDLGIGGDMTDGTDWGMISLEPLCGAPLELTTGQWFVWFRENADVLRCSNGERDGEETDVDCGGSRCNGCGIDGRCETAEDCEGGLLCAGGSCSLAPSCLIIHTESPELPSGAYAIDPDGDGEEEVHEVFCDMETDGGGWTLVGASRRGTLNDQASRFYDDLALATPTEAHGGVWNGMRDLASESSDVRFSCRVIALGGGFDVDLAFYEVDWYGVITTGSDAESCFNVPEDGGATPARSNLRAGISLPVGDPWDATGGLLVGEAVCGSLVDFFVDFDDAGIGGAEPDATDWGEDDAVAWCGTESPIDGAWFVWVRESD